MERVRTHSQISINGGNYGYLPPSDLKVPMSPSVSYLNSTKALDSHALEAGLSPSPVGVF